MKYHFHNQNETLVWNMVTVTQTTKCNEDSHVLILNLISPELFFQSLHFGEQVHEHLSQHWAGVRYEWSD